MPACCSTWQGQSFFRAEAVNAAVFYISAYREIEREGLKAVIDLSAASWRRSQARVLVLDGMVAEGPSARPDEPCGNSSTSCRVLFGDGLHLSPADRRELGPR